MTKPGDPARNEPTPVERGAETGVGLDQTISAPGTTPRPGAGSVDGVPLAMATPSLRTPGGAGPDTSLAPGAQLGRYVLVEPLGAGGMGMVFRAKDPDLGREVAVKVLRTGDGTGGALERRLLREAQAMATVSHDNLANVFDIGVQAGRVFIAMELVDGGSLRTMFADAGKTWRDKLGAVTGAGRGLAAAHSAGVIHRDFKPDNVLLARSGRAKVVDFGLARADRDAPAGEMVTVDGGGPSPGSSLPPDLSAHLTMTGALLGTPAYMAPEQHGGEIVDARSDQFAFAVTAWEALYGQRPFKSEAYSSLVAAVRAHDIQPPPKVAGVPPALEALLRRALSPDPGARFTSMDALLGAIEDAIAPRRKIPWLPIGAAGGLVIGGVVLLVASRGSNPSAGAGAALGPDQVEVTTRSGRGETVVRRPKRAAESDGAARLEIVPIDPMELAAAGDQAGAIAIDKMNAARQLERYQASLLECYGESDQTRSGRVVIELSIDKQGKVTRTAVISDDFRGTDVAPCIVETSKTWDIPPSQGSHHPGQPYTVRLPLAFYAPGDDTRSGINIPLDLGGFDLDKLQQLEDWERTHGDPPDVPDVEPPEPPEPPQ